MFDFRISDTFTDSLAKLTGEEQKLVKTTAFDLQLNSINPGMSLHKLDKAKDKNFWSVRVSSDIRLIVHKTTASMLLCYVDHHDKAYRWAERRKLETHPTTGAAQWVEIRERVEEVARPQALIAAEEARRAWKVDTSRPLLSRSDDELLGYGVPPEWLADVRNADEDALLALADHLPSEAAEALLELATGGTPTVPFVAPVGSDPFSHPDAQRRFRVMNDMEELERALLFPWEKWTIFLHPAQRQWVERDYGGPARVSGSAGTGKTIVALHRAVFLARIHPESRVLLTTFSDTLANALKTKLRRLVSNEPRLAERVEVHAMDAVAERLYEVQHGRPRILARTELRQALAEIVRPMKDLKFSQAFLLGEWDEVVDAWQLDSWEAYRDVKRLGRKTRLSEVQRVALWAVFAPLREHISAKGCLTYSALFTQLAAELLARKALPFDYVVVDEAQDVSVSQLRFLAALAGGRPNGLFFAGDLGQRIFQPPFSWKSLGVEVRGRSRTLHINYRTSHQIRMHADRLLGPEISDVDGNTEDRRGTVSVFNGPVPVIQCFPDRGAEIAATATWLRNRIAQGLPPHEVAIFVRSDAEMDRAKAAADAASLPYRVLDEKVEMVSGSASLCTMSLAKGLEFRAVAVMACDEEIVPLQSRIESVADNADLEEVYNTERHLLYVACTRARDHLLVTSVDPASEFLDDLVAGR
ncbi:UvrD-helicase domain-containing protein [Ramlibacter ginsenosidimutans]|uniref:DNA 3'-5' helicase n=1 Tax=Ramlibacter ginsenosidimutans TaxID=502333 RepID=A0A934TR04_9BURK|nr:UvrD-helicase domain-containing protein [Ramlibacter ginsenosidimutans]MBK6005939.1 UvrD-helicase domain-containing protein [Ramlibacter ginsenosidimutans]